MTIQLWSGKRSLNGPPEFKPIIKFHPCQAETLGPFGHRNGFSVECNAPVIAPIARLSLARSPSTISGLVVAIGINPVKRHSFRTGAHAGEKAIECHEFIRDLDASPSVLGVGRIARISCPPKHPIPSLKCTGRLSGSLPMDSGPLRGLFLEKAPARSGSGKSELRSVKKSDYAALTAALPFKWRPDMYSNNRKSRECLSGNVNIHTQHFTLSETLWH